MHKVLGCGIIHFFATLVRKEVPENTGDSNWGFYWLEHMYSYSKVRQRQV